MNAAMGDDLEGLDVAELYQNPQYAFYLAGMEMSINRAMLRMQTLNALPMGRVVLTAPVVTGSVATYDLGRIADFAGVYEVRANTGDAYAAHAYRWEGGTTLVVPLYTADAEYVLLYRKKVPLLTPLCADDTTVDVPDELACLIPYYVKSEWYEDEDAAMAQRARTYFEKGVADYAAQSEYASPAFESKYKWEEL